MISTKADNCAICGAEAETGYTGDDFALNRKRASCSDLDCYQRRPHDMRSDGSAKDFLLTVAEWNIEQREIAETEAEAKRLHKEQPRTAFEFCARKLTRELEKRLLPLEFDALGRDVLFTVAIEAQETRPGFAGELHAAGKPMHEEAFVMHWTSAPTGKKGAAPK